MLVNHEHRHEGGGSQLMGKITGLADLAQSSLSLHVSPNNKPAQGLYHKFGFQSEKDPVPVGIIGKDFTYMKREPHGPKP
jgi:hypothetical protein